MNRSVVLRIFLTLVLLVVMAGLGVFAFNAGVANGLAQNIQAAGAAGAKAAQPYPYPYYGMPFGPGYGFHGFGFLGCLVPLFLLFAFFGLTRAIFWHGPHGWRHHGMHGRYGEWEQGVPPMFAEWHRRAHTEPPAPEEKHE
jgi:hypothetical protein